DDRTHQDGRDEDAEVKGEKNVALLGEIDVKPCPCLRQTEERAESGEGDAEDEHRGAGGEKKWTTRVAQARSSTATGHRSKILLKGKALPSIVSSVKTFFQRPEQPRRVAVPHTRLNGKTPGFTSDVRKRGAATMMSPPRVKAQTWRPPSRGVYFPASRSWRSF